MAKQRQAAGRALILSILIFFPRTGKRRFGVMPPHYPELFRSENFFPLLFGFVNLFDHIIHIKATGTALVLFGLMELLTGILPL